MIEEIEKVAKSVIYQAGGLVKEHIGKVSSHDIHNKGPFDYVTAVDTKSQALITDAILRHFPDHHIMAEEASNSGIQGGFTWIIDPIDGTTNFIHGFPFVAISIGVCKDKEMALGLVLDPLRDELFSANRGGGAYLNGRPIHARNEASVENALIATGFPFRTRDYLESYLSCFRSVFQKVSGIRRAGSAALDLAYLAAGRVDGFWEAALSPWDIAAGSLIVSEAGGLISDFWGKDEYLTNGNIVAGTTSVYPFLFEQVRVFMAPAVMK
jgi:myo-inositol-1(or 4)-monophosphatase